MADIINEIDEDLRRDRAKELWRRYGKYAVAAALIAVLAAGGYTWWRAWERSRVMDMAERYESALDVAGAEDGGPAAAASALETLAAEATDGYALIARLRAAAYRGEAGEHAAAAALYGEVADDGSVDRIYRDLAEVMAVAQASFAGGSDPQALLERIDPLAEGGGPWRFAAREVAAGLALRAGDAERARGYLTAIVDDEAAPSRLQSRATEILRAVTG